MFYATLAIAALAVLFPLIWPIWKLRPHLAAAIAIIILCSSFGLYQLFGMPHIVPLLEARQMRMDEVRSSILTNSELVKHDNRNLSAWVILGQNFMETGQYNAAANAFKQTVLLSNGSPVLLVAYAKAMIAADDGNVSAASKKALEMALIQDRQNADARYLLAVYMLQEGKNEQAMKAMKELYRSLPEDAPLKATIDRQIGRQ